MHIIIKFSNTNRNFDLDQAYKECEFDERETQPNLFKNLTHYEKQLFMAINIFRFAPSKFLGYLDRIHNELFSSEFKNDQDVYLAVFEHIS